MTWRVVWEDQPVVNEKVDSPSHYGGKGNPHEVWKCLEAWGVHTKSVYVWNAIKYLARAGRKEGESALTDVGKAKWYIEKEILRLTPEPKAVVVSAEVTRAYVLEKKTKRGKKK